MKQFKINILVICCVLLAFGCKPKLNSKNIKTNISSPAKQIVIEQLKRPWSMAFISEHEAIVAEKDGDLTKVNLKTKSKISIKGFPNDLADSLTIFAQNYPLGTYPKDANGFKGKYNAGIFEVLLDPEFESNHWIYVSYVSEEDSKFALKVIRAKLQENQLENVEKLLFVGPYADGLFHFGGGMIFGGDGKLYVTAGERLYGDALQPDLPIAQNIADARGKIYRINKDGSIPIDNPDFGIDAVPGIYALGIRAAQGLTMNPMTKEIWFSEHGTYQGDELNLLEKGANYGWPIKSTGGYRGGYEPPKLERDYADPKWYWHKTIAPTGLTYYTGDEFPEWNNTLIIPGLSRGNFWRVGFAGDEISRVEELFVNDRQRTRKAVQSPEGKLYILTDENNGKIIRIVNKKVSN